MRRVSNPSSTPRKQKQAANSRIPTNILTELHRPQRHKEAKHGYYRSQCARLQPAGSDEEGNETSEKAPGNGSDEKD